MLLRTPMRGSFLVHGLCLAHAGSPCVQQPRLRRGAALRAAAAVDAGEKCGSLWTQGVPLRARQSPCTSKVPRMDARKSLNLDYKESQPRLLPNFEYQDLMKLVLGYPVPRSARGAVAYRGSTARSRPRQEQPASR